jgi:PadR family transcriptional regulator PadR
LELTPYVDLLVMATRPRATEPRLTHQSHVVLSVFLDDPAAELAGADLLDITGLFSGTLYPILMRFEQAGWLRSHWEKIDPSREGRPRRRLYRITPAGKARATALRAEILGGLPA